MIVRIDVRCLRISNIIHVMACIEDIEIQTDWKEYYLNILSNIVEKGKAPLPPNPLWRIFCCQHGSTEYILYENMKYNAYYVNRETIKEVCSAYVAAYDNCRDTPKKAVLIRKYIIELLTMYVKSCHSLSNLEPQRSIIQQM